MRSLFNPRPSPGGRSGCVEPTSIDREARPPSPYLHGLRSRGLPGLPLRPGRAGSACPAASGSYSAGRPPPESLPARNGSPFPRSGPESSSPARRARRVPPAGQERKAPSGVGGSAGPELPRRRPAEEAGRVSFHGPVTLPLLFRLCWRLRGEAKTWRPPKSVGVACGRASGPKAPSLTKPLRRLPGRGGRAGRPAGAPPRQGPFPNRRRRCSFPRRGRRAEQAALDHQEHGQAGPGDRGAAPRPGPAGGGQGDPAGPAEQRADPEGPGHGKRPAGRKGRAWVKPLPPRPFCSVQLPGSPPAENQREAPGHRRLRVRKGHPQQPGAGQDREGHR